MDIETQKFTYCLEMYQRWLSGDYLTMGEIDAALRGYFAVQRAKKLAREGTTCEKEAVSVRMD